MRLLVDEKDLIELVERDNPMPVTDFRGWLAARDARVVLTFTNVTELTDCFRGVDDLLYIRSIVQAVESLPVTYLRETLIEIEEIEAAVVAFEEGREPDMVNPCVDRWDQTFAKRGETSAAEMIVGYRLDMIVFD